MQTIRIATVKPVENEYDGSFLVLGENENGEVSIIETQASAAEARIYADCLVKLSNGECSKGYPDKIVKTRKGSDENSDDE